MFHSLRKLSFKAVCIYWITSSLISGVHATLMNSNTVRSLLYLPSVCSDPVEARRTELLNYISGILNYLSFQFVVTVIIYYYYLPLLLVSFER